MNLADDNSENHPVQVVNDVVNRLDDTIFDAAYPGGSRDGYHPKMLTKVIISAYTQRIYSSRQKNGQLKSGYNVQTGTENLFIIGNIHRRTPVA